MYRRGFVHLLIPFIIVSVLAVYFGYEYLKDKYEIKPIDESTQISDTSFENTEPRATSSNSPSKTPFCKNYGTSGIKKTDLFEEYSIGPGETMRMVAKKFFSDETKATLLIDLNPELYEYEIDDDLPMAMKIFIPNEKYNVDGVNSFFKTSGNVSFNSEKPMFGVNAPNSGTGPFIITDELKDVMKNIKTDDCIDVLYGSKGYDPIKVVFEVTKQ